MGNWMVNDATTFNKDWLISRDRFNISLINFMINLSLNQIYDIQCELVQVNTQCHEAIINEMNNINNVVSGMCDKHNSCHHTTNYTNKYSIKYSVYISCVSYNLYIWSYLILYYIQSYIILLCTIFSNNKY